MCLLCSQLPLWQIVRQLVTKGATACHTSVHHQPVEGTCAPACGHRIYTLQKTYKRPQLRKLFKSTALLLSTKRIPRKFRLPAKLPQLNSARSWAPPAFCVIRKQVILHCCEAQMAQRRQKRAAMQLVTGLLLLASFSARQAAAALRCSPSAEVCPRQQDASFDSAELLQGESLARGQHHRLCAHSLLLFM